MLKQQFNQSSYLERILISTGLISFDKLSRWASSGSAFVSIVFSKLIMRAIINMYTCFDKYVTIISSGFQILCINYLEAFHDTISRLLFLFECFSIPRLQISQQILLL